MMRVLVLALTSLLLLGLAACGGNDTAQPQGKTEETTVLSGAPPATFPVPEGALRDVGAAKGTVAPTSGDGLTQGTSTSSSLETLQRQVISTASLSLEVEDVSGAVAQLQAIAQGLGGLVQQLSRSGTEESQRATIVLRVPQEQFFTALGRIEALGKLLSQSVGVEDVTEQFIDLEARLQSAIRQEQSLLALLQKAESVSEILTIERELTRVRSEIEKLQGQRNFLQRRVEMATITVTLSPPAREPGTPPSASLSLGVSNVPRSVDRVKAIMASLNGAVDKVAISVREGKDSASISARVFIRDFSQALAALEELGKVIAEDIQEGSRLSDAKVAEKPNAPIFLSLQEQEGGWSATKVTAIAAPLGSLAFLSVLGLTMAMVYRVGRRRAGTP